MGELEKCLEDNEHLPELFIKHVSETLMMTMMMTVTVVMVTTMMTTMVVVVILMIIIVMMMVVQLTLNDLCLFLPTGAKTLYVRGLLPEQTAVRVHRGRI